MVAFNINCCALDAYWGFYVLHTVIAYFTAEDWVCTSTEVCVSDMNLVKVFPQLMHWYGFSPVCVLKWFTRRLFIKKHFMHWIYLYCFSQECFPRSMKKNTTTWESLVTLDAGIWSISSVFPHMHHKITIRENLDTVAALINVSP